MSSILRALRTLPIYVVTGKTKYNSFDADAAVPAMDAGTLNDLLNAGGALGVTQVTDITGLTAWKDYIPVQNETGRTVPFSYDANGYFPIKKVSGNIFQSFQSTDVKLLLHMNGANGGTTFTDSSTFARTVTASGSLETQTAVKKYGTASLGFSVGANTTTYLSVADTTALELAAQNFTIQGWVRYGAAPTNAVWNVMLSDKSTGTNQFEHRFGLVGSTSSRAVVAFYWTTDGLGTGLQSITSAPFTPTLNQFYHVCAERVGNTLTLYLDGVSVASGTLSGTIFQGTAPWRCVGNGSTAITGTVNVDDLEIIVGAYRYGAAFTPPTAEITNP